MHKHFRLRLVCSMFEIINYRIKYRITHSDIHFRDIFMKKLTNPLRLRLVCSMFEIINYRIKYRITHSDIHFRDIFMKKLTNPLV